MFVIEPSGMAMLPYDKIAVLSKDLVNLIGSLFIVIGGAIPYVFQYAEISHRRNASGFSLYVCLVLLVANILRLMFRIGKRFDDFLTAQAIVMILTMFAMLQISTRQNRRTVPSNQRKSVLRGHVLSAFWQWHDLKSFVIVTGVFAAVSLIITLIFSSNYYFVEAMGFVSLGTESTLAFPQILRNCKRRSCQGMSIPMVITWLLGDVFKLIYFLFKQSPLQFKVCASIQITADLVIMGQVFAFGRRSSPTRSDIPLDPPNE